MGYETFTVEKRGAAEWVTLNRPEVLNAISLQMVQIGRASCRERV